MVTFCASSSLIFAACDLNLCNEASRVWHLSFQLIWSSEPLPPDREEELWLVLPPDSAISGYCLQKIMLITFSTSIKLKSFNWKVHDRNRIHDSWSYIPSADRNRHGKPSRKSSYLYQTINRKKNYEFSEAAFYTSMLCRMLTTKKNLK